MSGGRRLRAEKGVGEKKYRPHKEKGLDLYVSPPEEDPFAKEKSFACAGGGAGGRHHCSVGGGTTRKDPLPKGKGD